MKKDMHIVKLAFRMVSDPTSKKLVNYVVLVKLSCGKVFKEKRTDVAVAIWYMAGTWLSNAQGVLYNRMIKHRKKCETCRETKRVKW